MRHTEKQTKKIFISYSWGRKSYMTIMNCTLLNYNPQYIMRFFLLIAICVCVLLVFGIKCTCAWVYLYYEMYLGMHENYSAARIGNYIGNWRTEHRGCMTSLSIEEDMTALVLFIANLDKLNITYSSFQSVSQSASKWASQYTSREVSKYLLCNGIMQNK